MLRKSRANRHAASGEALLETALVLLALLVTLIGTFDFGQVLFFHQTFRERVRAGARYAVVNNYDPNQIRNIVVYNSTSAPPGNPAGLFGLTPAMVNVTRHDAGTINDRIEVTITNYPLGFVSPTLLGATLKPTFRAVAPVESLGATN